MRKLSLNMNLYLIALFVAISILFLVVDYLHDLRATARYETQEMVKTFESTAFVMSVTAQSLEQLNERVQALEEANPSAKFSPSDELPPTGDLQSSEELDTSEEEKPSSSIHEYKTFDMSKVSPFPPVTTLGDPEPLPYPSAESHPEEFPEEITIGEVINLREDSGITNPYTLPCESVFNQESGSDPGETFPTPSTSDQDATQDQSGKESEVQISSSFMDGWAGLNETRVVK